VKRFAPFYFVAAVCICALIATPAAWGQASTSLRGTITDPTGAAIPSANVRLINADTNLARTSTSDAQGNYVFPEVQPGNYSLAVEVPGFAKYQQSGIQLLVNLPATINVKMKIGSAQETVTVTEQAPIVNSTDASQGNTMNEVQLQQLPIEARDIVQLLSLQPGVVYTSDRSDVDTTMDTRSGAVNGERSDQSNVSLDGVDDNEQASGLAFTSVLPVPIMSVEEFRVSTSNYGIDQGRSAGGQVGLVTRGGSNDFHGNLYEFNRSGIGEANDWFIKNSEAADGSPNTPTHLVRNIFGGDLGGPVKRDRLFFFFNYEGHRIASGSSTVREIPTATLRDGIIEYPCAEPSACPGGSVTGLSGKSYSVPAGVNALNAQQLTAMDPLGIGPSPVSLKYFNTYPLPNDTSVGDGYNFSGYRFSSPEFERDQWLVGRIDYKVTSNGNHTLFWRGSGRDDIAPNAEFLPGTPPEYSTLDRSKGMVAGYTALLRANLVNNFRYGLTRQSLDTQGISDQPWIVIRNLSQPIYYGNSFTLPTNNFVDTLAWTKGNHQLTFGTDIRIIRNASSNYGTSFSYAIANASWLNTSGIANTTSPFSPDNAGYPAVNSDFDNSYDFPLIGMLGIVSEINAQYNYHLNPTATGTPLAQGAPVLRHWASDEYDLIFGDSWKLRPNLTFNYGLRYDLMSPVWETSGQQVAPTTGLQQWFEERYQDMQQGIADNAIPLLQFGVAGPSYGKPGYYSWQKKNFAPRVSFAWSPEPKGGLLEKLFGGSGQSVIRAGWGLYYDHFGQELTTSFDQNGAFGLATNIGNPAGVESVGECGPPKCSIAPRVEPTSVPGYVPNFNTIPTVDLSGTQVYASAPPAQFPETPPSTLGTGGFCICWGVDSSLKTPYSYQMDLSYQRQIGRSNSIEVAYVGTLGRRLLVQEDVAQPLNLTDPKTGVTYYQAAQALAKLYKTGVTDETFSDSALGKTASYWKDVIQPLQSGGAYGIGSLNAVGGGCVNPTDMTPPTSTSDPALAIFDLWCTFNNNETSALATLDAYGGLPDANLPGVYYTPIDGEYSFYSAQYSSLYAWRTLSNSNYNALQVTFKRQMSQGLLFNFNYTYSKSLDLASDAERIGPWGGFGTGQIINAWDPNQLWAVSDFDLRHQFNGNWVWQIPVGRGRHFGSGMGKGADALIGGWQFSGLARWTSGFPVNVSNGYDWPTNWQLGGQADLTGSPVPQGRTLLDGTTGAPCTSFTPNCVFNMFSNRAIAFAGFAHNEAGQSGVRNAVRGDGYAGTDLGLDKTWTMPYNDRHTLEFEWNVFNVANLVRFDGQSAFPEVDQSTSFGNYDQLFTNPRVMQFALVYSF
jgi:Carboxypeptidase regulatory-like domain